MGCSNLRPRAISPWCTAMPMWQRQRRRSMLPWHRWRAAKYRPQELRSELRWLRRAEFSEQFCFRVRPLNRFWMPIELIKIGLELLLQRQRTRKIVRCEDVTLYFAEDDLDLIQPTGMCRQPVNPHFKGQRQRRNPGAELFRGMRRAVIENQIDDLQACAQGTLKQL